MFKYTNFFLASLERPQRARLHVDPLMADPALRIPFTPSRASHIVMVYRAECGPSAPANFLLFILFFPHLIAGPIVRARDFLPQIKPVASGHAVGRCATLQGPAKKSG